MIERIGKTARIMIERITQMKCTPWRVVSGVCVIAVILFVGSAIVAGIYEGVTGTAKLPEPVATVEVEKEPIKEEAKKPEPKKAAPWVVGQTVDGLIPKVKTLGAGTYDVGTEKDHLVAGRYVVSNVGRGEHFVVRDGLGELKVNTILGNGSIGSGDYTYDARPFDKIETAGKVKFTPCK